MNIQNMKIKGISSARSLREPPFQFLLLRDGELEEQGGSLTCPTLFSQSETDLSLQVKDAEFQFGVVLK